MTVDAKAKQAMANIMTDMGADPFGLSMPAQAGEREPTYESNAVATRTPILDEGGQAMKNILLCLEGTAGRLVDDADTYPQLKAALVTERTDRGARIGSWEIVKHSSDEFDVVHVATGEPIAKSLRLYEAAYALVTGLNAGKTLTDAPIRKILALEEQFSQHLEKATHFKHMAKKLTETGERSRAAIAEDRFDDARDKAVEERDQLLRLAGLI